MHKVLLPLGFLALSFLCLDSQAETPLVKERQNMVGIAYPIQSATPESTDDLATELTIYSLIAGIYTLYWLKQRA